MLHLKAVVSVCAVYSYTVWCASLCSPDGWWAISNFGEISGSVAIEMQNNAYIHAMDSGLFTLGAPHKGENTQWRASEFLFLRDRTFVLLVI